MISLLWNRIQDPIQSVPLCVAFGFLFDLAAGDPSWLPHPVLLMGKAITGLEKGLRARFPDTPAGQKMAGTILAVSIAGAGLVLPAILLFALQQVHPLLRFLLETIWCWHCLAVRDMVWETDAVYRVLKTGDLEKARKQVSRIVGRDTACLDSRGVIRAAVETTAENLSDGVIAPLLYMVIGGAPLALFYKCVNTMDSMIGYRNEKYLYFGRTAARMDDLFGFIPARLAAFSLMLAAAVTGRDAAGGFRIWKRDRYRHASPNSAQTESTIAGILHVRLAGPASYFGQVYEKPYIGDPDREITEEDILTTNKLFVCASWAGVILLLAVRILLIRCLIIR